MPGAAGRRMAGEEAMAGLLTGRHAVTHHRGMTHLTAAGAVTSGPDVGLHLLERELGPQVAVAVG